MLAFSLIRMVTLSNISMQTYIQMYCLFCGRRRVAVARYRMICLVHVRPSSVTDANCIVMNLDTREYQRHEQPASAIVESHICSVSTNAYETENKHKFKISNI